MKKSMKIFVLCSIVFILSAFKSEPNESLTGTFGSPDKTIQLIIKDDHSFLYTNFSSPTKPLIVSGTWEAKNKKVHLKTSGPARYHKVWKISPDGRTAKSQNGLLWYTLGRQS
jgi:hypothetical protein